MPAWPRRCSGEGEAEAVGGERLAPSRCVAEVMANVKASADQGPELERLAAILLSSSASTWPSPGTRIGPGRRPRCEAGRPVTSPLAPP